jgi:predicted Zn-dependent peptidase
VSKLGVRELKGLHERAYHPGNIVVAAAGNLEHDVLVETLERTGWGDPQARSDGPLETLAPVAAPVTVKHVEREGAQTHVVIGSPTVPYSDPRRHAIVLVGVLLGGGMSSRLFQRVREELGLAYSVYGFQSFHVDTGMHGVYVGTAPATATQAVEAINAELARVAREGLSAADLASAKSQLKGQITLSLESPSSRMYRAAGTELYGEPFRTLDETLALIDAITGEDVAAVAAEFFAPDRQTVLSLGPSAA